MPTVTFGTRLLCALEKTSPDVFLLFVLLILRWFSFLQNFEALDQVCFGEEKGTPPPSRGSDDEMSM